MTRKSDLENETRWRIGVDIRCGIASMISSFSVDPETDSSLSELMAKEPPKCLVSKLGRQWYRRQMNGSIVRWRRRVGHRNRFSVLRGIGHIIADKDLAYDPYDIGIIERLIPAAIL